MWDDQEEFVEFPGNPVRALWIELCFNYMRKGATSSLSGIVAYWRLVLNTLGTWFYYYIVIVLFVLQLDHSGSVTILGMRSSP